MSFTIIRKTIFFKGSRFCFSFAATLLLLFRLKQTDVIACQA